MDFLTALTDALITVLEEVLDILDSLDFLTALTEAAMAVLEEVTAVLETIMVAMEAPGPYELVAGVLDSQESSTTTGYSMTRPRCPKSTPMREATPGTDGASRPGATSSPSARPCSRSWTGSSDATNIQSPRT